jgi:hypothetical protein
VYDSPSLFCTSSSFMCHHSWVSVVATATLTLGKTLEQENGCRCCSKLVTLGYFTFSSKIILSWLTPHMTQLIMTFSLQKIDRTQRHFINCHLVTCLHSSFQSHAVDTGMIFGFTCSRYLKQGNNFFFHLIGKASKKIVGLLLCKWLLLRNIAK